MQVATTFAGEGDGGDKSSLVRPASWRSRNDPSRRSRRRRHLDMPQPTESLILHPLARALRFGLAMRKSVDEGASSPPPPEHGAARGAC